MGNLLSTNKFWFQQREQLPEGRKAPGVAVCCNTCKLLLFLSNKRAGVLVKQRFQAIYTYTHSCPCPQCTGAGRWGASRNKERRKQMKNRRNRFPFFPMSCTHQHAGEPFLQLPRVGHGQLQGHVVAPEIRVLVHAPCVPHDSSSMSSKVELSQWPPQPPPSPPPPPPSPPLVFHFEIIKPIGGREGEKKVDR